MLHMTFYSLPFTPERPQATEARLEKIYEAAKFGLKGDSLALAAGLTRKDLAWDIAHGHISVK